MGNDFVAQLLRVPATQVMVHVMDKDSHKWIPTYISYTCKAIAVIIAYHIQKIIAAFYSATRGGLMVFRSLFAILDRRGIVHVDHNETYLDEVLGWTLAAVGFYFQYTQVGTRRPRSDFCARCTPSTRLPRFDGGIDGSISAADVLAAVRRRAPALAAPDHRVRAALRRRVDERAGRRLGACSLQGVHK